MAAARKKMKTSLRRRAAIAFGKPFWERPLARLALSLALVLLVFWPTMGAQFAHWDDNLKVWRNPHYQPVSLENRRFFWPAL